MPSYQGFLFCPNKFKCFYLDVQLNTAYDLKGSIDEFIYFYNHERYKKRLNGLSPLEFMDQAA
ncbi:IS3 family transposase [Ligilactobacillus acidipiscis]|uniref:IS3 family transposase n=1 Tax=Ligilactobacillus acidipiscis TaxID=89059 RepID=UPI003D7B74F3